jgi:TetR/AcrR family transcriptional regulator, fatty acid metabolism regulator protein
MDVKVKRNNTRAAIMKAALELFSKEDFNQATMRSIAKKAKIVPSNIYKYFENKDELLSALLDAVAEQILKGTEEQFLLSDSTREKIYKLTYYYLDYYQKNPGVAYLIYGRNTLQHWYEYHSIYNRARELGNMLISIVEEGRKKGEVRQDIDIHVINHIYHGGIRNLVTSWLYHNYEFPLTDSAGGFASTIYFAVSAKSSSAETFVCPYYHEHHGK